MSKKNYFVLLSIIFLNGIAYSQSAFHSRKARNQHSDLSQLRTEAVKVKLDSIVLPNKTKEVFYYNSTGDSISYYGYNWNIANNKWEKDRLVIRKSAPAGFPNIDIEYQWNAKKSIWVGSYYDVMIFNSMDLMTSIESYDWDSTGNIWKIRMTNTYGYDAFGNENYLRYQSNFNDTLKTWEYVTETFSRLVLNSSNKVKVQYDSTIGSFNGTTYPIGKSFSSVYYTYDAAGNLLKQDRQSYKFKDQKWYSTFIQTYNYDSKNREIINIRSSSDTLGGDLIDNSKYAKNYDANGNISEHANYYWDKLTKKWVGSSRDLYYYDNNIVANSLWAIYNYKNSGYNNKITTINEYDWVNGAWASPVLGTLYYSDVIPSGIELYATNTKTIKVFPNPAIDMIEVSAEGINEYRIQDLSGKTIQQSTLTQNKILVADLIQGTYILSLYSSNGVQTSKFVKQ